MRNDYEPLVQFSPLSGGLICEAVSGTTSGELNPENNVEVAAGADRSMYVCAPASGCPHAKQTQVLMVLRDTPGRESAERCVRELGLARLAEDRHFLVVLPEPARAGWNYSGDPAREDDADFIVRCFAALPKARTRVAGFNGMIYHLACGSESSAMALRLAAIRPLDAAAVMAGPLPEGFSAPEPKAPQVGWAYGGAGQVSAWLARANGEELERDQVADGAWVFRSISDPSAGRFEGGALDERTVGLAWDAMFSLTRRWRNDVYGTYQERIDFEKRGYVSHVGDCSLGLADGLPRTWHELVPASVAESDAPAPLVIYLHGINCCGSYGAEQSRWGEIAERDGLMAVFPDATAEMRWNGWADDRLPQDMPYILALIDHMNEVHPVDRSRVYLSGFSMGSMFANSLAAAYPEVFAGVVALNGPHMTGLGTLDDARGMLMAFRPDSAVAHMEPRQEEASPAGILAACKHEARPWMRIPVAQFVGLLDGVGLEPGRTWPLGPADADGLWPRTVAFWLARGGAGAQVGLGAANPTGIACDDSRRVGTRSWELTWRSSDDGAALCPYRLIATERIAHAVDPAQVELGWDYVRGWAREADGGLGRLG